MLEDWQLVAILIGSGTRSQNVETVSKKLLHDFYGLSGLIYSSSRNHQKEIGIGKAKSASLIAVKEIISRVKLNTLKTNKTSFQKIYEHLYLKTISQTRECFYTITLNHQKQLINIDLLSKGGLESVGVYTRDIVKIALDDAAKYLIISHNHPKQISTPSIQDFKIFENLKSIMSKLDIILLDQWVLGNDGIFSCAKNKKIHTFKKS